MAHYNYYSEATHSKVTAKLRQAILMLVCILIGILISSTTQAQDIYHKNKARFYKSKFRTQIREYTNACSLLEKKKYQKPKSHYRLASNHKPTVRPMAEVDPNVKPEPSPRPQPKPAPKPEPVALVMAEEKPSPEKLQKLHDQEDKVLQENHLPTPTSKQHEVIREMVALELKNKKDNEPIELAPLYFNYDQDEFSVVDMNPFLIAVEYALQGKTILIEGHTDSDGHNQYNVQLSIKRVQKIRQLMHDMGVPDDRISVVGYGEEVAQHDNKTTTGRQKNRRVDFKAF